MSNKVENIVLSVVAVLAVAVVVVLYICGARRQSGMECGGVRVNVTDSKVNKFVSEGDVKKIVSTNYGDITGVFADSIDLVSMERLLEKRASSATVKPISPATDFSTSTLRSALQS